MRVAIKYVLGISIGAILGFGYYKLIGCATGTCPITSNPWSSTIYGTVIGLLFVSMIQRS